MAWTGLVEQQNADFRYFVSKKVPGDFLVRERWRESEVPFPNSTTRSAGAS